MASIKINPINSDPVPGFSTSDPLEVSIKYSTYKILSSTIDFSPNDVGEKANLSSENRLKSNAGDGSVEIEKRHGNAKKIGWKTFLLLTIYLIFTCGFAATFSTEVSSLFSPMFRWKVNLSGQANSGFNSIEISAPSATVIFQKIKRIKPEVGYTLEMDLRLQKMGRLEILPLNDTGEKIVAAELNSIDFWPFAQQVMDGHDLIFGVQVFPQGNVKMMLQRETRPNYNRVRAAAPNGFAVHFIDCELSIMDIRFIPEEYSRDYLHVQKSSLRGGRVFRTIFSTCAFVGLAMLLFSIGVILGRASGKIDAVFICLAFLAVVVTVTPRQTGPAPFVLAIAILAQLKTAFVFFHLGRRDLSVFLVASTLIGTLFIAMFSPITLSAFFLTVCAISLYALQESVRFRHQIKAPQATALLLVVAVAFCTELAARSIYPEGGFLRGAPEKLFWGMVPLDLRDDNLLNKEGPVSLQEKELPPKDQRNLPAVVLMGGSVVYGSPDDPSQNLAQIIQRKFENQAEIYNSGFVGASSYNVMQYFRDNLIETRPEIVVAYLRHNDIFQQGPLTWRQRRQRQSGAHLRGFFAHSRIYRIVAEKISMHKTKLDLGRCSDDAIVNDFRANLNDLADRVAGYGGTLIVFPEQMRIDPKFDTLSQRLDDVLKELAQRQGVFYYTVTIPPAGTKSDDYFTDYVHLTPLGYQYLSKYLEEAVYKALKER